MYELPKRFDFDKLVTQKVWDFFKDIFPKLKYESREEQENMALDICDAIMEDKHIMIEAGVGIGKSYAYLVPLMYYNRLTNYPVVVSTSTILLQEQLIKDIDKLSKIMRFYPDVVLAKGMSHFVCKKRAIRYLNHNKKIKKLYPWLEDWIGDIKNGDRAKLPVQLNNSVWNNINIIQCNLSRCDEKFNCYYTAIRDEMLHTNGIILCNHDLLAVDAQKKNKMQRPMLSENIKLIVIDEAHNLEGKVRNSLKKEWSLKNFTKVINKAFWFIKISNTYYGNLDNKIFKLLEDIYGDFLLQVKKQYNKLDSNLSEIERFYIDTKNVFTKIRAIIKIIDELNTKVQLSENSRFYNTQDDAIEELENASDFLKKLISKNSNMLFWIELIDNKKVLKNVVVVGCIKDLNNEIRQLFFAKNKPKTILTSATLTNSFNGTNEERYSYIINSLGYPVKNSGELSEPKESPYPYNKNSIIYYKENMPHPIKDKKLFIKKCIDTIIELLTLTKGKAMILFTAKSDMMEVYSNLINKKLPWKILIQQEGSSQSSIISEFKSNINSVLLGTGVYWEGISIEGIALSNLIIVRLPFPVPDPIIDYKRSLTSNPLMDVNVPEMLIKLRQGVGRLIRNNTDKGIITILDSRINDSSNQPYKNKIWKSLPMKIKTNDINVVKKFIKENFISN